MISFVGQGKIKRLESPVTVKEIELPFCVKGKALANVVFTSHFLSLHGRSLPVSGLGQFGGKSN